MPNMVTTGAAAEHYVMHRSYGDSKRSPDERSDIRGFLFASVPAYRCAHAGCLLLSGDSPSG
jgi:hypothetical protein